jgi:serine/threonine protein kinase
VKGSAYQSQDHYNNWIDSFLYSRKGLRNRFVLSYTLAQFFAKFYEIKEKSSLRRFDLECTNFDLKPENVLVRLEHDNITGSRLIVPFILDLDNLTLRNNLNTLGPASPNITPEYMAPEGPTSRYYDNFSLGVILYQVLVGIHPFEGIAGVSRFRDGTERNYFMKNRCFPGGKNGPFLSCASEHQRFEKMPEILKKLFRRALDAQEPSARPTPREWQMALAGVLSDPTLDFSNLFELPDLGQPTSLLTAPRTPPSLNIPILNTQVAKLLAGAKNKICAILA